MNTLRSPFARFYQWCLSVDSRSRRILCSSAWLLQSKRCFTNTIGFDVRSLGLGFDFEHICKQIVITRFILNELREIDLLCVCSLPLFLFNKPQQLFIR